MQEKKQQRSKNKNESQRNSGTLNRKKMTEHLKNVDEKNINIGNLQETGSVMS